MLKKFAAVLVAVAMLGACEQTGMGQKEGLGTLGGAGVGALAGSQIGSGKGQLAAVAIGALLGAFAGRSIGQSLDRADQAAISRAGDRAQTAPIGQTIAWDNPDTGHHGTITPTREGRHTQTGEYCREFRQTVSVGGKTEEAYGTACRQPDGSWKIVN